LTLTFLGTKYEAINLKILTTLSTEIEESLNIKQFLTTSVYVSNREDMSTIQAVVRHLLLLQAGENKHLYFTSVPEETLQTLRICLCIGDKKKTELKLTYFPHIFFSPKLFY
jgi:hypothetical protein